MRANIRNLRWAMAAVMVATLAACGSSRGDLDK